MKNNLPENFDPMDLPYEEKKNHVAGVATVVAICVFSVLALLAATFNFMDAFLKLVHLIAK